MSFRLFGFDVEIKLGFWVTAVLLASGLNFDADSIKNIIVWTPILLVSILVHELGHAFAIKWYGLQPSIQLHFMGGLTTWRELLPVSRRGRIVIALAGPFAGFLLGGLVLAGVTVALLLGAHPEDFRWVRAGIRAALYINFIWGLVNLMPVLPFDGGHVLEHALGPRRRRLTLMISAVVGIGLALAFLALFRGNGLWGAYLFGSAAATSIIQLRGASPATRWVPPKNASDEVSLEIAKARAALDADDPVTAINIVTAILDGKPIDSVRVDAQTILVWAELMRGDPPAAERALSELRRDLLQLRRDPDRALTGNVALAAGRLSEARSILEKAYADGDHRKEVFGPLIQVLLRQDAPARAASVALERFESLSSDDARQVATLAIDGGAYVDAAKLLERVGGRERSRADVLAALRAFTKGGARGEALDALKKAFVSGIVSESEVRGDSELGALLTEPSV